MIPVEIVKYLVQELKRHEVYGIFRELIPHTAISFSINSHYTLEQMLDYFRLVAQLRRNNGNHIVFVNTLREIEQKARTEDKEYLMSINAVYISETFNQMMKLKRVRKEMQTFLSILALNNLTLESYIAKGYDIHTICNAPLYRLAEKHGTFWLLEFRAVYYKLLNTIINEKHNRT